MCLVIIYRTIRIVLDVAYSPKALFAEYKTRRGLREFGEGLIEIFGGHLQTMYWQLLAHFLF
jgi:hypothetical protein